MKAEHVRLMTVGIAFGIRRERVLFDAQRTLFLFQITHLEKQNPLRAITDTTERNQKRTELSHKLSHRIK